MAFAVGIRHCGHSTVGMISGGTGFSLWTCGCIASAEAEIVVSRFWLRKIAA